MQVKPYDLCHGTLELHNILISRIGFLKGCPYGTLCIIKVSKNH